MKTLTVKTWNLGVLLIACTMLFFASCQKDDLSTNAPEVAQEQNIELSSTPTEVISGVLHLNQETIFEDMERITNLSEEDLNTWEQALGFTSMRTAVSNAMKELDNVETKAELEAFEAQYADILVFTDTEVKARYSDPLHATFANTEGIYYVGQAVFKLMETGVIEVRDGDLSKLSSTKTDEANGVYILNTRQISENKSCSYATYAYKEHDKRRVNFELKTSVGSCGCGNYKPMIIAKVWGQKKNIWGKWKSYKTSLVFEQVSCSITTNAAGTINFGVWSGSTSSDATQLYKTEFIGSVESSYSNAVPTVEKIKGRASSRGVGNRWAVICCGYYTYQCPSAY